MWHASPGRCLQCSRQLTTIFCHIRGSLTPVDHRKCILGRQGPQLRPHSSSHVRAFAAAALIEQEVGTSYATQSDDASAVYQHREAQRGTVAVHSFRIKGVSFEGRQDLVKNLDRGEAVMMVPEPENEYDQHAVAVKLLDGTSLGYVPRDINQSPIFHSLPGHVKLGHVRSVGPATESNPEMHGASVEHQPTLVPLLAPAIPLSLVEDCAKVEEQLGQQDFAMGQEARAQSAGRCQISGVAGVPLVPSPVWREDAKEQVISLSGVRWVAAALQDAQRRLLQEPEDPAVLWAFQAMNGWIQSEAHAYRAHQMALQSSRGSGWRLNVVAGAKVGPKFKAKAPTAPKQGLTSYQLFSKDERVKIKQELPDLKFAEVNKELGKRWKAVTPDQKSYYEDLSKKDKERYIREQAAWEQQRGSPGSTSSPAASNPGPAKSSQSPAKSSPTPTASSQSPPPPEDRSDHSHDHYRDGDRFPRATKGFFD